MVNPAIIRLRVSRRAQVEQFLKLTIASNDSFLISYCGMSKVISGDYYVLGWRKNERI
jgi:hypothetical protein